MRTNVYVDGFNLYYGAVRQAGCKWLNLEQLFRRLRPHDSIQTIYYFTALINGSRSENQLTYLKVLETLPSVRVILGRFKDKTIRCGVKKCSYQGDRRFIVPEEKRTDVQIAITMLRDAWEDNCDRLVLVSGDSDLVPAVDTVKEVAPDKVVSLYIPALNRLRGAAVELRGACDSHRILPNQLVKKSLFPTTIPDGNGGVIAKPSGW